eukprot:TRINITY_DN435_c0_g1_i22.p1 TRINITY_DN435_c0_g1~~TRINITY_DN435_c0_g1_i22.p1  ORF type:complete len:345 (-),score=88.12 TRINITY_DN435_c0_g1_i22:39-1073(-)
METTSSAETSSSTSETTAQTTSSTETTSSTAETTSSTETSSSTSDSTTQDEECTPSEASVFSFTVSNDITITSSRPLTDSEIARLISETKASINEGYKSELGNSVDFNSVDLCGTVTIRTSKRAVSQETNIILSATSTISTQDASIDETSLQSSFETASVTVVRASVTSAASVVSIPVSGIDVGAPVVIETTRTNTTDTPKEDLGGLVVVIIIVVILIAAAVVFFFYYKENKDLPPTKRDPDLNLQTISSSGYESSDSEPSSYIPASLGSLESSGSYTSYSDNSTSYTGSVTPSQSGTLSSSRSASSQVSGNVSTSRSETVSSSRSETVSEYSSSEYTSETSSS